MEKERQRQREERQKPLHMNLEPLGSGLLTRKGGIDVLCLEEFAICRRIWVDERRSFMSVGLALNWLGEQL